MLSMTARQPENAYAVDTGHFQVEMDLVAYSYVHDRSDVTESAEDVNPFLGLTWRH